MVQSQEPVSSKLSHHEFDAILENDGESGKRDHQDDLVKHHAHEFHTMLVAEHPVEVSEGSVPDRVNADNSPVQMTTNGLKSFRTTTKGIVCVEVC